MSFTVIGFIVSVAVGIVASIYTLRWYLYSKIAADGAQIIASVINVVQIQLMTLFFNWTAFRLTDMENQRTDTIYEDSMIVKLFCFQFVNNYASFYYLAFVAGSRPIPPGGAANSAVNTPLLLSIPPSLCNTPSSLYILPSLYIYPLTVPPP